MTLRPSFKIWHYIIYFDTFLSWKSKRFNGKHIVCVHTVKFSLKFLWKLTATSCNSNFYSMLMYCIFQLICVLYTFWNKRIHTLHTLQMNLCQYLSNEILFSKFAENIYVLNTMFKWLWTTKLKKTKIIRKILFSS